MYGFWRATVEPYAKGKGKSHHQEMSLYTGDDSDGSSDSQKKWSNKKKSRRNNPQDARRCYGCGKKGHIKRDCRSGGQQKKLHTSQPGSKPCSYCHKKGHSVVSCWKKNPKMVPEWHQKSNQEIAGIALEGETAFMSIQASIPVETINEDKSLHEQEDSDSDDDSVGPPPLTPRTCDLEVDSSDDEDSDDEDSDNDDDESIGPPPEFSKTYQTKVGQILKGKQD